jgi:hypothetical protein
MSLCGRPDRNLILSEAKNLREMHRLSETEKEIFRFVQNDAITLAFVFVLSPLLTQARDHFSVLFDFRFEL